MEHDLIAKSRAGDEEAFSELVSLYRPRIFQGCLGILHEKEAAEDVTQESFIRAYNHLADFQERSSFYTWIWRIAHNLAVDYLKKEKAHGEIHEEMTAGRPQASDEAIQALLPLLPTKQKRVFELFYIQGLSQKEIAEKLDLPYGTVRSRLHYARRKLKQFRSKV